MAGQTINDRLLAARHSIAGQGLAKSVCKATTEEMIGPKKKHLDYLVQCTNEPNVSIPQLANLLVERSQNTNWIVVYKALITVHHMMCYGNERFTQYLASSNSTFQLSNFLDKSGLQGVAGAKIGYDMSPFIRRYARYLNEKAISYRTVAFDFCKVRRGKEDGTLRTMNAEKLLKTLPTLQNQLDALLEFDCAANNLNNGVINMCFMLLFRDLIRLFACYNDGVINLLEKYFDMNKKQCRDALDLYKKFLIRMDRVGEFLKVAENMGIDKGDIPDLTKAPSSLLDALEQHLASVEGKKSTTTTPTQSANNARDVKFAVTALSSTSSAFGTAATNGRLDNGIDESLKQQVLAEEEAAMNQYKSKVHSPNNATNPFLSSTNNNLPTLDLFAPTTVAATPAKYDALNTRHSDDLLQLNNPFADVFGQPAVSNTQHQSMWITNGNGFSTAQPVQTSTITTTSTAAFVSESNFSSVFGNTDSTAATGSPAALNPFLSDYSDDNSYSKNPNDEKIDLIETSDTLVDDEQICVTPNDNKKINIDVEPPDLMLDLNEPVKKPPPRPPPPVIKPKTNPTVPPEVPQQLVTQPEQGFDGLGSILQPANTNQTGPNTAANNTKNHQQSSQSSALLTGDLETSLASLAENLSINKGPPPVKGVQWNSPKNGAKTGSSWTPQPMAATTGIGYRPMGQGMASIPAQPIFTPMQPMGMRPMVSGPGMLAPMGAPPQTTNPQMAQQSLLFH